MREDGLEVTFQLYDFQVDDIEKIERQRCVFLPDHPFHRDARVNAKR